MSEHLELVQGDIIRCGHSDWWKKGDGVSPGYHFRRLVLLKVQVKTPTQVHQKYLTRGIGEDNRSEWVWDVLWLSQAYVDQFAKKLMEAAGE